MPSPKFFFNLPINVITCAVQLLARIGWFKKKKVLAQSTFQKRIFLTLVILLLFGYDAYDAHSEFLSPTESPLL